MGNGNRAPKDHSRIAASIARKLDRLEPGEHFIRLQKPQSKVESWIITIENKQTGHIWRKAYYPGEME